MQGPCTYNLGSKSLPLSTLKQTVMCFSVTKQTAHRDGREAD